MRAVDVSQSYHGDELGIHFLGELAVDQRNPDNGNIYRLLLNRRTTSFANNPVGQDTANGVWEVTRDESNQAANMPMGIGAATVAADRYGWYQVAGVSDISKATNTAAVAEGAYVALDDGNDGRGENAGTIYNNRVFGRASVAAAFSDDNIERVYLRGLI